MSLALKTMVFVMLGLWPALVTDVTEPMKLHGINYERRSQLPNGQLGRYEHGTEKILLHEELFHGSATRLSYIAAHEIVHMIRFQNGLHSTPEFEERLAILAATEVAILLGFPKFTLPPTILEDTFKVNNLEVTELTPDEREGLNHELEATLQLARQLFVKP